MQNEGDRHSVTVVRSTSASTVLTRDSRYRVLQCGRRQRSLWNNAAMTGFIDSTSGLRFKLYALVVSVRILDARIFLKSPSYHYDILRVFVCEKQNTSLRRVFGDKHETHTLLVTQNF
jgi:hypothetical protein